MSIKPVKISQHKLRRYKELTSEIEDMQKKHAARLKPLTSWLNEIREELITAALAKAEVQSGPLVMQVSSSTGRRTPAWKTHAIALAEKFKKALKVISGDAWAEDVLEKTTPGKGSKTLTVIDRREVVV